jgi:hypothetical protein
VVDQGQVQLGLDQAVKPHPSVLFLPKGRESYEAQHERRFEGLRVISRRVQHVVIKVHSRRWKDDSKKVVVH